MLKIHISTLAVSPLSQVATSLAARSESHLKKNIHHDFCRWAVKSSATEEEHILRTGESVTTSNKKVENDIYLCQLPSPYSIGMQLAKFASELRKIPDWRHQIGEHAIPPSTLYLLDRSQVDKWSGSSEVRTTQQGGINAKPCPDKTILTLPFTKWLHFWANVLTTSAEHTPCLS